MLPGFFFFLDGAPPLAAPTLSVGVRFVDSVEVLIGAVADATGYEYRRSDDGGTTWIGGGTGWVSASSGSNIDSDGAGGLPHGSGETLTYEARAVDGSDPGESAQTTVTMPTYQSARSVSASGSSDDIAISYSAALGSQGVLPDGYDVLRATTVGGTYASIATSDSPPGYDDLNVGFTVTRWYKLRSRYVSPDSGLTYLPTATDTTPVSATTDDAPLDAPVITSLTLADIDVLRLQYTFDGTADGNEYRVLNGGGTVIGWTDIGTTTDVYIDDTTGLPTGSGQTLTVEVRSYITTPAQTSAVDTDTQTMPTFSTPTGVTATADGGGANEITVAWTSAGSTSQGFNPTGVWIERGEGGGSQTFLTFDEDGSPYNDTGLGYGVTYDYSVFGLWRSDGANGTGAAYPSAGDGNASDTVALEEFTVSVRDEAGTADGVEVQVPTPTGLSETVQDYQVYARRNASMSGNVANGTLVATYSPGSLEDTWQVIDSTDLAGLTIGDTVYVIVRARTSVNSVFGQSPEDTATVTATIPDAPTVTDEGYKDVLEDYVWVNWNAVTGADSYEVEVRSRDDAPGAWGAWATPVCTNGLGSATDLDPETEAAITASRDYQFRVRATNGAGSSAYTESAIITGTMTAGTPTTEPGDCI